MKNGETTKLGIFLRFLRFFVKLVTNEKKIVCEKNQAGILIEFSPFFREGQHSYSNTVIFNLK